MCDLLVARFGFLPDDVLLLLLTDSPLLPTGANICSALTQMVDRSEPVGVLLFHYSGHGTLIPSPKPRRGKSKRDDEEAIVPCDFNLITNLDFRRFVDRLPSGVSLTVISDSFHSGGLIDNEKEQIGPQSNSGLRRRRRRTIPFESVLAHVASLSGVESPDVGDQMFELFGDEASARLTLCEAGGAGDDGGILLSGCQKDETLADVGTDSEGNGTFSNSIQAVMREREGAMSNRKVVAGARELLRRQGFPRHPCLYCSDQNAESPFLCQPAQGPSSAV